MEDFASLLSRVASNDPSMFEMVLRSWTRGLPSDRAELVQRVVAALATNTHVKSVQFRDLQLTEAESVPLAELLKRRDFEQLDLAAVENIPRVVSDFSFCLARQQADRRDSVSCAGCWRCVACAQLERQ
eukprot:TRINITY_DN3540_c0_g1_i12.p1 TRINITY_DN3540_c0_g1~~TRINITY_DN3540_c0_g1_i12.p1  ORF type:complete len:129 (+),score=36.50 TRINITY_DN3540_c0_g1_i12:220-606(+)